MNAPSSKRRDAAKKGPPWGFVVVGLLIVTLASTIFVIRGRDPGGDDGGDGPGPVPADSEPMMELTRAALSATENLETAEAEAAWAEVFGRSPQDKSVALNRALNRVLRVDTLAAQAMNSSLEDADKQAARAQLPSAIDSVRTAIGDYVAASGDSVLGLWLDSRIDLLEASLLPRSMTKSLREKIYHRLAEAVAGEMGKSPRSIVLAGPLTEVLGALEDPIDGLPEELRGSAATALDHLSNQNPGNLFVAIGAARLNISAEKANAITLVLRTQELAKAIEPSLLRQTKPIGLTPDELVAEITAAIATERWADADRQMLLWFNVLNPTELVKADRRRASPHPLDRLSFDSLRRLSAEVSQSSPAKKETIPIAFESIEIVDAANTRLIRPVDFDLDLDDDLATISDDGRLHLWNNDGSGGWTAAGDVMLDIRATVLIAVDLFMVDGSDPKRIKTEPESSSSGKEEYASVYRHNTFPSLVALGDEGVRLVGIDGRKSTPAADRLHIIDTDTGLEDLRSVTAAIAGDLEGDGDLDLVVATQNNGIRLFVNRGNRTFFEVTEIGGDFQQGDPVAAMAIVDLDRDLDLDVVTVHPKSGRVGLLENLLHLQFRHRVLKEIPPISKAGFVAVADIDANVSWDLIIGGEKNSTIVFSQTADAGSWTVDRVETKELPLTEAVVADFDNDSWSDVLNSSSGSTTVSRMGPWGFDTPLEVDPSTATQTSHADFNADGKVDYVSLRGQSPVVNINRTESLGHFMTVRFKGIDDNAASSGRVNHFAIGSVLELRFGPHYRSAVITSPSTHFGLGAFEKASSLRVVLPNGLTQTIRDPSVNALVEEEQKLKGSCPYLYAWDGEKFVFMTDCLWAAPLGLQVARGVVAKDRPWEYLKVDGRNVKPRDGRYEFRITEELWEVAYIEKIAMSAIDRPVDVEVWTNEKVGPGEIATPTVFAFRKDDLHPLEHAMDTAGRDVTDQLLDTDRDFVQGFDRRLRQGLCPPHHIDLDFGDLDSLSSAPASGTVHLLLTGWILPTDTSLNIQIDQNPNLPAIEFPSVWVPDTNELGGWRKAIPYMGFPGGKTKTIVVDVTKIIDAADPRLRIRTSAQIYWDSAKIAIQNEPATVRVHELDLLSAEVAYRGFSARQNNGEKQPESYDYHDVIQSAIWPPLRGRLTQLGDCVALVRDWDDSMAVISSGDEIRFSFSVPPSPIPDRWQRDFVLHCVGWDKDADLNTLAGQTIGPLPFRRMMSYPPTAVEATAAGRVQQINHRHRSREQSFRSFWYRGGQPKPSRFLGTFSRNR